VRAGDNLDSQACAREGFAVLVVTEQRQVMPEGSVNHPAIQLERSLRADMLS